MNQEIMELSREIGSLLIDRTQTVGIAESSTGGLVSAYLLAVPGASSYFLGGSVIYTRFAGRGFLGVSDEDMRGLRAATESYAALNAGKVKSILGSTWGVSETGATGPKGNRYGDQAGHTCIAVSGPVNLTTTLETGSGDREKNMTMFTIETLTLLIKAINS
jgi:PncC family amidohydrolase